MFEAVTSNLVRVQAEDPRSPNVGDAEAGDVVVRDQDTLNAFYPDELVIEFSVSGTSADAEPTVTVRRASDNRVLGGYDNVPYVSGMNIEAAGVGFRLTGEPESGDKLVLSSTNRQNILSAVGALATGIREVDPSQTPEAFDTLIANSMGVLEASETRILEVRADIGARLNTLDTTESFHADIKLQTQEILSEVRDLDYAEAVSELSLQSFVLEAAQQSYARIANLSLFNSL